MNRRILLKGYASRVVREGRLFRRLAAELQRNEGLSLAELVEYQTAHLRRIVAHAAESVPYYTRLFGALDIRPNDIRTIADLARLPVLHKSDIRGHESDFVSRRTRWKVRAYTTGTSGTPLFLTRDRFSINFERATHHRQRRWAGVERGARKAVLRSERVVPADRTEPPFWQYVPPQRTLMLSGYHLSERTIPYYLDKLRSFRPVAIEAYPWSIHQLARYMETHAEPAIPVRAVFTSSERLFEHQRELIGEYFGPVFDLLGNAERVMCIMMCERGRYHYAMDYSILEFEPSGDGRHHVIGTTLHNRAMPLFRYATGDLVELSEEGCPCGRSFPVIESIVGREDDLIHTPSGRSLGCMNTPLKGVPNVVECQLVQESIDALRVLIVPGPRFTDADEAHLVRNLREFIGTELRLDVERTDSVERMAGGKHKLVISRLPTPPASASDVGAGAG